MKSFLLTSAGSNFDKATGSLQNVSLMTGGREATGHGVYIDETTLASALSGVKGGALRGYLTHDRGLFTGQNELDVIGYFSGVKVEGDRLRADSFTFYDAFKKHNPGRHDQLVEMAEKTPELFGLSVEVMGRVAFVAEDGTEFSKPPAKTVPLKYGGMPALRVTELRAVAFVAEPAANDGLFARLRALLTPFTAKPDSDTPPPSLVSDSTNPMNELLTSIRARFAAVPGRLTAAFAAISSAPAAAVPSEADVVSTVLTAEVTDLTTQLTTARTDLGTMTTRATTAEAEVVTLKKALEAAKKSSFSGALPETLPANASITDRCRAEKAK